MDNFITHKFAKAMGLPSSSTSLTLRTLEDRQCSRDTRIYKLKLMDMYGVQYNIEAIGLESMT